MCVRDRENECVTVCVWERRKNRGSGWVCVCVCVWEREREREKEKVSVWLCVWGRERESVCVYEQERNDFLIPTKAFWTKKKSLRCNKTDNHSIDINWSEKKIKNVFLEKNYQNPLLLSSKVWMDIQIFLWQIFISFK